LAARFSLTRDQWRLDRSGLGNYDVASMRLSLIIRGWATRFPVDRSALALVCVLWASVAAAQERAYFVTYDHYLEERGNLEVAVAATTGVPKRGAAAYTAPWLEIEYGVTGWWTSELYLEGVTTRGDGNAFTGWRIENRFRPLAREHRVNPVLYIEYEDIN